MHSFPHADFIAQCKELGYDLHPQCRLDGSWTGGYEGTYGDIEIFAYVAYNDEQAWYTAKFYGDEVGVAMFICKRHCNGWKRWFVSSWASWLKGISFEAKDLTNADVFQWGQS